MEYSINKLAKLSGVSTRTLRYYDEIKLLSPLRISSSGYRIYGEAEVDLLQQILFYREMELPLNNIKTIITNDNFDKSIALQNHLQDLLAKENQLRTLILTVQKTILYNKGEKEMTNEEKFSGLKKQQIAKNEEIYGNEIRQKYGNDIINNSNKKFSNLSKENYDKIEKLSNDINSTLKLAIESNNPASDLSQKAAALHKEWLICCWPDGLYTKEAHLGLAQMYCDDERFKAYYENIAPGCAELLNEAIKTFYQ